MITIEAEALAAIEAAARGAFPIECCGLLVGWGDRIVRAVPTANLAARVQDSFEIDAAVHLRLQRELRGTGFEMMGVFHSHPAGVAEPSARDRAQAAYRGWIWLITAVNGGRCETRAFRHERGGFTPLGLRSAR